MLNSSDSAGERSWVCKGGERSTNLNIVPENGGRSMEAKGRRPENGQEPSGGNWHWKRADNEGRRAKSGAGIVIFLENKLSNCNHLQIVNEMKNKG